MEKKMLIFMPLGLGLIILFYFVIYSSNKNNEKLVLGDEWAILLQHKSDFEDASSVPHISFDSLKFQGSKSALMAKDMKFGPTFESDSLSLIQQTNKVDVQCQLYAPSFLTGVEVVFSLENEKGPLLWKSSALGDSVKAGEWFPVNASFPIEEGLTEGSTKLILKVYLINNKGEEFYMDDFSVALLGSNN